MIKKYRGKMGRRMLRDLVRQYIITVKIDLSSAGFKVFPFLFLGFNLKHIVISLLLPFTGDKNILEVKAALLKPFRNLRSLLRRRKTPDV
jgi:hypothetical protein